MNDLKPDFSKYADRLIPVVVQDANSNVVLMLGFMNEEALIKTRNFFQQNKTTLMDKRRSKQKLFTSHRYKN
jgi:phosphoribosyl-ATP pyrophosphohydrolase/phosphoribosyl-AMP cyclohydrolase